MRPKTAKTQYDVVVIGGGAGGLAAARSGARRGARTLLVHDGPLGGECTFTGCVPSKALLAAAAAGLDFDRAMARVRASVHAVAETESSEVLVREGVTVVHSRAHLLGPPRSPHRVSWFQKPAHGVNLGSTTVSARPPRSQE